MLGTISRAIRLYRLRRQCPAACANTVDPITQEDIKCICTPMHLYFGTSRAFVCIDAVAAAEYIMATGDTRNTITQQEMNAAELRRLDKITRGCCESVLGALEKAKKKAVQDFEHAQLCQAMETEPAELWSAVMDAPFTDMPHLTVLQLGFVIPTYGVLLREYAAVCAESARQFHSDNLRNLECMNLSCGDRVLHTRIRDLLQTADVWRETEDSELESDTDTDTESEHEVHVDILEPPTTRQRIE